MTRSQKSALWTDQSTGGTGSGTDGALTTLKAAHRMITDYRPLAIGVSEQLAEIHTGQLSKTAIRRALAAHCRSDRYLRNHTEGTKRLDLAGNEIGAITAKEAEWAAGLLAARHGTKQRKPVVSQPSKNTVAQKPILGFSGREILRLRRPRGVTGSGGCGE